MNVLPNNEELERQLVGQSILDNRPASREIAPADFYSPLWRECWAAIAQLDADGKEIEPFAIERIVKPRYKTADVMQIKNSTLGLVFAMDSTAYGKQLKNLSARRYLIHQLSNQMQELETNTDVTGIVDRLESCFDKVRAGQRFL